MRVCWTESESFFFWICIVSIEDIWYYLEYLYLFFALTDLDIIFIIILLFILDLIWKFTISEFLWITMYFNKKHNYSRNLLNFVSFEAHFEKQFFLNTRNLTICHYLNLFYLSLDDYIPY